MILRRISETEHGTWGVLLHRGAPFCVTLERTWRDNQKGISCIPLGRYVCKRVKSPKFGDTFEVTNVINRSKILFHVGNLDDDTHGCIIIGEEFGWLRGKRAVLRSRKGFLEFQYLTKDKDEFSLWIEAWEGL